MMNKEDFILRIKRLYDFHEYIIQLSRLGVGIWERNEYGYMYDSYVDMIAELVDEMYKETIYYFIYDLDFGQGYVDGCFTDGDKVIDISSAGKLYDYIVGNKQDD